MGAKNTGDITDQGHVLATAMADNGVLTAQVGDVISNTVNEPVVEMWTPFGFASRPSDPDPGTAAAEGVMITGGDRNKMIAGREMRCSEVYGNLAPGEFCVFAPGADAKAMGKVVGKADGSITLATTDNNTHDGNGIYFRVGPEGISAQSPFGSLTIGASGIHLVQKDGASVHLVGTSNPLSPNAVMIKATQVYIDTPRCQIAPTVANGGKGVALPVVVAPVGSPEPGVPVPIGGGVGVVLGVTGSVLTVGL